MLSPSSSLPSTGTTKLVRAPAKKPNNSTSNIGLLDRPFGAPTYPILFATPTIDREQLDVSKVNFIYHSAAGQAEITNTHLGHNWSMFLPSCSSMASSLSLSKYAHQVGGGRWSGQPEGEAINKSRTLSRRRRHVTQRRKKRSRRPPSLFYLIPLHGGIWHLCVDLQSESRSRERRWFDVSFIPCISIRLCPQIRRKPNGIFLYLYPRQ